MISFPKAFSAVYLLFMGILVTLLGLLDPMEFFKSVIDDKTLFEELPGPIVAAMKHMAVVTCLVFILFAAAIFASTWFLGQAKSAMYMGIFVMAVSWLSDFLHPRPGDTITFLGVTYKAAFDPTVIVCFNIFLYANSTAVNESKPSTSSHLLSKVWIVIYAAVLGSLTAGIILDPVNMYLPTVGRENWDATPKPIQMAMERVAFVFSLLLALASTTPSIFWVYRYHKPIGPLLFILCFWTLALGFAHLVYPFPNEGMTVPELVDGVPAPIFILGGISILMSSICLYVEKRRSTAALKSKQS